MGKKHKPRLKKGLKEVEKPLYLNANLIYSEALNYIKKPYWKRNIKTGTLTKLKNEGYGLVTSILTRMEIMQRLHREENKTSSYSRRLYTQILQDYEIAEIIPIEDHIPLNVAFIDAIGCSKLDFKDALHLTIARKLKMPVCTHDKKFRGDFSQHEAKKNFYERVFKPEELIKPKKK